MMNMYSRMAGYYEQIFPLNPKAAEFVLEKAPDPCEHVLDIGCGSGAMARCLAGHFRQITAVDPDPNMLDYAKHLAGESGLDIFFYRLGMESIGELEPMSPFDMLICLGNTLPHLTDIQAIEGFLRTLGALAGPGALLMVQTVNFDRIQSDRVQQFPLLEKGDIRFHRTYRPTGQAGMISFETRLELPDGAEIMGTSALIHLSCETLVTTMSRAGYTGIQRFGDFNGGSWTADSPATIVLASIS